MAIVLITGLLASSVGCGGPVDDPSDVAGKGDTDTDTPSRELSCDYFQDRLLDCVAGNYVETFAEAYEYCESTRLFWLHKARCNHVSPKPDWCDDYKVFKADYWPTCRMI